MNISEKSRQTAAILRREAPRRPLFGDSGPVAGSLRGRCCISYKTLLRVRSNRRSSAHNQTDDEQNQKHDEKNPCDLSRRACNATKPEQSGDQRNHEKSDSPIQHRGILLSIEILFFIIITAFPTTPGVTSARVPGSP